MRGDAGLGGEEFGSVEVDYSIGDIVTMQLASWRYWLRLASFPFFLFGLLSLFPVVTQGENLWDAVAAIDWWVAAILSAGLISASLAAMVIGYVIRRLRGKHSDIRLSIDGQGVMFWGPDGEGTIFWTSLSRIWSNEKRLMFFLSSNTALILPRRCFSDSATFDHWVEFSKARWAEAKNRGQ